MNPSDESTPRDNARAFSIMFFATALLFAMLGWAEGIRTDTRYLHIPETAGWMIAAVVMIVLGVFFLARSRKH